MDLLGSLRKLLEGNTNRDRTVGPPPRQSMVPFRNPQQAQPTRFEDGSVKRGQVGVGGGVHNQRINSVGNRSPRFNVQAANGTPLDHLGHLQRSVRPGLGAGTRVQNLIPLQPAFDEDEFNGRDALFNNRPIRLQPTQRPYDFQDPWY